MHYISLTVNSDDSYALFLQSCNSGKQNRLYISSDIIDDFRITMSALFLIPFCSGVAGRAGPIHFLLEKPGFRANVFYPVQIIQNHFVVFPFLMAESGDPHAGKFRTKRAALGAVIFVADHKLAGILSGGITSLTAWLIGVKLYPQGRAFTLCLLISNHAPASAAV